MSWPLKIFQAISEMYSNKLNWFISVYIGAMWICTAFIYLYNFELVKEPLVDVLAIIVAIFGFGVAFIGSQNIQYSITKILLRYKYLQILTAYFIFAIFGSLNYGNQSILYGAQFVTALFLFGQSFLLIDKMFEPEELIVDVILPMILVYENRVLKNNEKRGSKFITAIYGILRTYKNIEQPYTFNDSSNSLVSMSNAELDSLGKAISRLAIANSLKVPHLLYAIGHYKVEEGLFHKNYKDEVDGDTYKWFVTSYIIARLTLLAESKQVDQAIYIQLLFWVFMQTSHKETNDTYKHGKLGDGFLGLILRARNKALLIGFMNDQLEKCSNGSTDLIHDDTDLQILKIVLGLSGDFVYRNSSSLVLKTRIALEEEDNLLELISISTTILNGACDKRSDSNEFPLSIEQLVNVYCEFLVFLYYTEGSPVSYTVGARNIIDKYFELLFFTCDKWLLPYLKDKLRAENVIINNKEYADLFVNTLSSIDPDSGVWFINWSSRKKQKLKEMLEDLRGVNTI